MSAFLSLLPFLLLLGFWLFLFQHRRTERAERPATETGEEKLDAILDELRRIRRELADRNV